MITWECDGSNRPTPSPVPAWPTEYQQSPQHLTPNDQAGANYSAEDLARLKERMGIK
jgi:hypothetical protein